MNAHVKETRIVSATNAFEVTAPRLSWLMSLPRNIRDAKSVWFISDVASLTFIHEKCERALCLMKWIKFFHLCAFRWNGSFTFQMFPLFVWYKGPHCSHWYCCDFGKLLLKLPRQRSCNPLLLVSHWRTDPRPDQIQHDEYAYYACSRGWSQPLKYNVLTGECPMWILFIKLVCTLNFYCESGRGKPMKTSQPQYSSSDIKF